MENFKKFEHLGLEVFSKENPLSLVNKLPPEFSLLLEKLPTELLNQDEDTLRESLRPTATVGKLRMNFWVEYYTAVENGLVMVLDKVHRGICSKETFNHICKTEGNLLWLITPITSWEKSQAEILELGISKLREIMQAPLYDLKRNFLPKNAMVILKAYEKIEQRVLGAIVQKSINVQKNVDIQDKDNQEVLDVTNETEFRKRMRQLEDTVEQGKKRMAGGTS